MLARLFSTFVIIHHLFFVLGFYIKFILRFDDTLLYEALNFLWFIFLFSLSLSIICAIQYVLISQWKPYASFKANSQNENDK